MPYKWTNSHIKLGEHDRRRSKLTDEDKVLILKLHKEGMFLREIARRFKKLCSRRLIQFIIYPERLEHLQKRNKENEHWKKYHDRVNLTKSIREWRKYKQNLIINKVI